MAVRLSALGRSWMFWAVLAAGAIAALAVRPWLSRRAAGPPPPFMFQLPSFELTDQRGRPFGSAQLRGRVWIASFVFTTCPTICPRLMMEMAKVQARIRELNLPVHIVSFSVDPLHDSPAKLAEYGRRYGADETRWSLLTGPLDKVEDAVKRGFKLAMERQLLRVKDGDRERELFDIVHGARFVLLDKGGGIRGYYETDDESRASLIADARRLLEQSE